MMSLELRERTYAEPVRFRMHARAQAPVLSHLYSAPENLGVAAVGEQISAEPTVFKDGAVLAPLLLLLQTVASPAIAIVTLYASAALLDVTFDASFVILGVLAALLALVLMQPPRNVVTVLLTGRVALVAGQCARWALLIAVMMAVGYLTEYVQRYPSSVLIAWSVMAPCVSIAFMLLLQTLVRSRMVTPANARRAIFVGCNETSRTLASRLSEHAQLSTSVAGFFDDRSRTRLGEHGRVRLIGTLADVPGYVRENGIDAIYISLPLREVQRVQHLLAQLHDTTASMYYLPDVPLRDPVHHARPCDLLGVPVVALCETPFYGCRGAVKRLMDVVLASMLVIGLAPVLAFIALAVKRSSPGPVIFRQRRYGLNGQEILVYKFRTMTVTEDGGKVRQATRNDQRTTPIGRVLRRYSLDELPQLFNVLQGRMSLVGPRPHAVAHNEEYRKLIRGYMIRHKMLPGMTGLAQVNGCRGEIERLDDLQARVHFDLKYLSHWSPLLDLKILFQTAAIVFRDEKAY